MTHLIPLPPRVATYSVPSSHLHRRGRIILAHSRRVPPCSSQHLSLLSTIMSAMDVDAPVAKDKKPRFEVKKVRVRVLGLVCEAVRERKCWS